MFIYLGIVAVSKSSRITPWIYINKSLCLQILGKTTKDINIIFCASPLFSIVESRRGEPRHN